MKAHIIETLEGRIILTKLETSIGPRTHCIELHRRTVDSYSVVSHLFTTEELGLLANALVGMTVDAKRVPG